MHPCISRPRYVGCPQGRGSLGRVAPFSQRRGPRTGPAVSLQQLPVTQLCWGTWGVPHSIHCSHYYCGSGEGDIRRGDGPRFFTLPTCEPHKTQAYGQWLDNSRKSCFLFCFKPLKEICLHFQEELIWERKKATDLNLLYSCEREFLKILFAFPTKEPPLVHSGPLSGFP